MVILPEVKGCVTEIRDNPAKQPFLCGFLLKGKNTYVMSNSMRDYPVDFGSLNVSLEVNTFDRNKHLKNKT